jgi:ferric-dicitrate binding protein FerR (iron transport regulator)
MVKEEGGSTNAASWVTNKLVFHNAKLSEVRKDIEKFFKMKVVLSENLEQCLFSGEFNNPQKENVLEVIALAMGSHLRYEGNTVYFEGGSCSN